MSRGGSCINIPSSLPNLPYIKSCNMTAKQTPHPQVSSRYFRPAVNRIVHISPAKSDTTQVYYKALGKIQKKNTSQREKDPFPMLAKFGYRIAVVRG